MRRTDNTLTNQERKLITSLHTAKGRRKTHLFVAEGPKLIGELMAAFPCRLLVTTEELFPLLPSKSRVERVVLLPSSYDFSSISTLQTPRPMVALFEQPQELSVEPLPQGLALLLDNVQDPGNVGSILRTCDWFGIRQVYATEGTADIFSPKVVQSTMGALARVRVTSVRDLPSFMTEVSTANIPVYGTFLQGENLLEPDIELPTPTTPSLLVMGNEGKGVSDTVAKGVTHALTIPDQTPDGLHTESLNVAAATAIVLARLFFRP